MELDSTLDINQTSIHHLQTSYLSIKFSAGLGMNIKYGGFQYIQLGYAGGR